MQLDKKLVSFVQLYLNGDATPIFLRLGAYFQNNL